MGNTNQTKGFQRKPAGQTPYSVEETESISNWTFSDRATSTPRALDLEERQVVTSLRWCCVKEVGRIHEVMRAHLSELAGEQKINRGKKSAKSQVMKNPAMSADT